MGQGSSLCAAYLTPRTPARRQPWTVSRSV